MDKPRKRHCWECRRRCLVCDSAQPSCRRCSNAGIQCPGYSESKPQRLRWLSPGKVISQTRNSKRSLPPSSKTQITKRDQDAASFVSAHAPISRFEVWPGAYAVFEAAHYCRPPILARHKRNQLTDWDRTDNACIHPDMTPIHELGPNAHVYPLSRAHLESSAAFPDHVRLSLVCMTLSHRINRLRNETDNCNVLAERFYRYRGHAIRSLSDDVGIPRKQYGDVLLVSITSLLLADVSGLDRLVAIC
jgi:hypothetical protein